jgi:tetratricopeptide (TPR) repeat protein
MSHVAFPRSKIGTSLLLCVVLAALTWAVFGQTIDYGFVNYDDDTVYQNPYITNGFTLRGLAWVTTHVYSNNWQPLTSVSHMLDCQIFGLHPWGHHLTNILLHTAAVLLCFLVLSQMTGAPWRSAFVAALFAIHPLHVESVAWIAERKDVLSGLFFMLTLGAYLYYVRKPSLLRYGTVAVLFVAGLASKPMLVTLPLILLLLDYWPLGRFGPRFSSHAQAITRFSWKYDLPSWRLICEKLPLAALSVASCAVTLFAQGEIVSSIPASWRIKNAIVSCVVYIREMIWPAKLAVFYPHPGNNLHLWRVLLAAVLLCAVTFACLRLRRKCPYLAVGWLWYLIMLVPVIGFVQVGLQSHADRYTYLPQIGLYLAATWGVGDLSASWRRRKEILIAAGAIVVGTLVWCARAQGSYWSDSESLWRHALEVTPDNAITEQHLGFAMAQKGNNAEAMTHLQKALEFDPKLAAAYDNIAFLLTKQKRWDEAIADYEIAVRIKPDDAVSQCNLATAFVMIGKTDEAIAHYQKAIDINSDYAEAYVYLGNIFRKKNQPDKAIAHYQRALEIEPSRVATRHNLALLLLQKGHVKEAIACWRKNLSIQPGNIDARNNLAVVLLRSGHPAAAISEWQKILQIHPDNIDAIVNIAWVLATSRGDAVRDGVKALSLAQKAQRISFESSPVICQTLAAALAECGRFREAIDEARRGVELAKTRNEHELETKLQSELALYRANRALRDTEKSLSSWNPLGTEVR